MNYNGWGPWKGAAVSLKIEEPRMMGSVLFALNGHELFTFLDDPAVPADHIGTERDLRGSAAARSDGGTY